MAGEPTQYAKFQFLISTAAHVIPGIHMKLRQSLNYPKLVGIDPTIPRGAEGLIYHSGDFKGEVTRLSTRGQDIKLVQSTRTQHSVKVEHYGIAYEYAEREIERAMQYHQDLPSESIEACFRLVEEKKDKVFLFGEPGTEWDSFLMNKEVPRFAVPGSQNWDNLNGQEIFNQINEFLSRIWERCGLVRIPDTLVLPVHHVRLLNKPFDTHTGISIGEYLEVNNVITQATGRPLMIHTLPQLGTLTKQEDSTKGKGISIFPSIDESGTVDLAKDPSNSADNGGSTPDIVKVRTSAVRVGGNKDADPIQTGIARAVAYCKQMDCIRYHIPEDLNFRAPERNMMTYKVYGEFTLGGVEVREPNTMAYLDGI